MRLPILALTLLPGLALAQSTAEDAPTKPLQNTPSCAVGLTWDHDKQSCVVVEGGASPLNGLPDRHDCSSPPAVTA